MDFLRNPNEKEAGQDQLLEVLSLLIKKIPHIAAGSLERTIMLVEEMGDKYDIDREFTDFVIGRKEVNDEDSHSYELFVIPEPNKTTILAKIDRSVLSHYATPETYNTSDYYWFKIDESGESPSLTTECARSQTRIDSNGASVSIDKRLGVITGDRLYELKLLIESGKFDDAYDMEAALMLDMDN